jgi:maltooligosyltrehalose trehalohydrolase
LGHACKYARLDAFVPNAVYEGDHRRFDWNTLQSLFRRSDRSRRIIRLLSQLPASSGVNLDAIPEPVRHAGAVGLPGDSIRWQVWARSAKRVDLVLIDGDRRRVIPMKKGAHGCFYHTDAGIAEGQRYAYSLDAGPDRPDPCSLWQPEGVHGYSAVVRPERFHWTDHNWRGVRREDLVIYEVHVGTFTSEGTFAAMIPRLPVLKELGITALEIMPVAQFPGTRNWGYDGVGLYAAQNRYGGPYGLQQLVDACHVAGLAIFLDVVYNHLGPEGNYLSEFGPYFTDRYKTPWGAAVNYDGTSCDPVRNYVIDNAQMWLEEFHFDGLRLDAVHAIFDFGARHILRGIKERADEVARRIGRIVHVIAESDLNDPRLLLPAERGGYELDGQWADDFHHTIHALLTGERRGYYADFGAARQIAEAFRSPFVYAGDYSKHRERTHGAPPDGLAGDRFVVCIQNHDQVGNRPRGERLIGLLGSWEKQRLASSLLLLSPYLPLIFMGEEYGEERPFPFFCSFTDAGLVEAVRDGRRREFADFAADGEIPDPHAEETFASARLTWNWSDGTPNAGLRCLYRDLLTARREWPALRDFEMRSARLLPDADTGPILEVRRGEDVSELRVIFNLGNVAQQITPKSADQRVLFTSEATRYGGPRDGFEISDRLAPYECVVLGPAMLRSFI